MFRELSVEKIYGGGCAIFKNIRINKAESDVIVCNCTINVSLGLRIRGLGVKAIS